MTQTLELVRPEEYIRAADLLEQADRVLCMGQGGSMIIAMEAAHLFFHGERKVLLRDRLAYAGHRHRYCGRERRHSLLLPIPARQRI